MSIQAKSHVVILSIVITCSSYIAGVDILNTPQGAWLRPPQSVNAYKDVPKDKKKSLFPGGSWLKTSEAYVGSGHIVAFCLMDKVSRYCNSFVPSEFYGIDSKDNQIFVTQLANHHGFLIPEKSDDMRAITEKNIIVGYEGSFQGTDRSGVWEGSFKNYRGYLTIKQHVDQ